MMRSGSAYGNGLSTTVLITLKIAVFAPMPSVSVASAISVNVGCLRSERKACENADDQSAIPSLQSILPAPAAFCPWLLPSRALRQPAEGNQFCLQVFVEPLRAAL